MITNFHSPVSGVWGRRMLTLVVALGSTACASVEDRSNEAFLAACADMEPAGAGEENIVFREKSSGVAVLPPIVGSSGGLDSPARVRSGSDVPYAAGTVSGQTSNVTMAPCPKAGSAE